MKSNKWNMDVKNLPLRVTVILPLSGFFLLAMLISSFISFRSMDEMMSKVIQAQTKLISNSITKQLDGFFDSAADIVKINKDLIETEQLDERDYSALGAQFLSQIKVVPHMTYVSIGFPSGEYIGAGRLVSSGEINLYKSIESQNSTFNRFNVVDNRAVEPPLQVGEPYDATSRGWYQSALNQKENQWFPVYKYVNQDALGMGISLPVYNKLDNSIEAVVTADLALTQISTFISDLKLEGSEIIFISETDGGLVAINLPQGSYSSEHGEFKRFSLADYPDKRVAMFSPLFFDEKKTPNTSLDALKPHEIGDVPTRIKLDDKFYRISHFRYKVQNGIELVVGIILSEDDYTAMFHEDNTLRLTNTLIFLLIFGMTTYILFEKKVLPSIKQIIEAQKSLKKGDFSVRVTQGSSLELSELASGFNDTVAALEEANEIQKLYVAHEKLATLGGLVSGVTHEVNTPLGLAITISSFIDVSHRELVQRMLSGDVTKQQFVALSDELHDNMEVLQSNLQRAAEIINGFKVFAAGQSYESMTHFNVMALLQSIRISLKHAYKNRGHEIIVHCDENLQVYSYSGAMVQIFTNLIMNSLIHGFGEGVSGKVRSNGEVRSNGVISIRVSLQESKLIIEYSDNGRGMSPEVLERIYSPFFTTNRDNGGTGIGMNIIHTIVTEQLGGSIDIFSEPNKGIQCTIAFSVSERT